MLRLSPDQAKLLRSAVQSARSHPDLSPKLTQIYQQIQSQIDTRKPRCDISGRCCKFDEYGHKLFVTTIELALFIENLEQQGRVGAAHVPNDPNPVGSAHPTRLQLLPTTTGVCPYQINNLCTVHPIRPFGCRIYFCDPTAQEWQQAQYESFHLKIKELHDQLGVDYFYVEWLEGLKIIYQS